MKWIKNAIVCVCVCVDISFFIHVRINHCPVSGVCGLDSSRDLLFTPEALLSLFSSLAGCSASPFFSSTEYFKMQKCQHETLNPGRNWTKSWTLKCFYSRRKCFNPPLYCHYLFFYCVSDSTGCIPIHVEAFVRCAGPCHIGLGFVLSCMSLGSTLLNVSSSLSFRSPHEELRFVSQSHYVCNWISGEPFRAVWLSH